jgi:hypothetical protein
MHTMTPVSTAASPRLQSSPHAAFRPAVAGCPRTHPVSKFCTYNGQEHAPVLYHMIHVAVATCSATLASHVCLHNIQPPMCIARISPPQRNAPAAVAPTSLPCIPADQRVQAFAHPKQCTAAPTATPAPGEAAAGFASLDRRTLLLALLAAGQLLPGSQVPALADTSEITTVGCCESVTFAVLLL